MQILASIRNKCNAGCGINPTQMQHLYAIICKVSIFDPQNVVKNAENIVKALFYVT